MASPVVSLTCTSRTLFSNLKLITIISVGLQLISCSSGKYISKQADKIILSDTNLTSAHVGISIYDPSTNKYLYNHDGDKYFIPASNTKLFTCYAAMKHLGDSLVGLRYYEKDSLLVISGTGDPTFLAPQFKQHPVFNFLRKQAANRTIKMYQTNFQSETLGFGWAWDDYLSDDMSERSPFPIYKNVATFKWQDSLVVTPSSLRYLTTINYGERFRDDLTNGLQASRDRCSNQFLISKGKNKSIQIPFVPESGDPTFLSDTLHAYVGSYVKSNGYLPSFDFSKKIHSQTTDSVLKPMMHRSDNFFAEQMLLMVSNEMTGVMNDEKIIDSLLKTDFKDLPQKPRWVDGCGLSRYNLFSPQDMVTVLNKMKNDFSWNRITTILATGGEGTLTNYYLDLKNRIFAKTGTLSNNVALSGFLITKHNKTLIFSVIVNNHMGNTTKIRKAVEKYLTAIAEKY